MSALFKDEQPSIKTRRKRVKARVEKKRPKCPDGYYIDHDLNYVLDAVQKKMLENK